MFDLSNMAGGKVTHTDRLFINGFLLVTKRKQTWSETNMFTAVTIGVTIGPSAIIC